VEGRQGEQQSKRSSGGRTRHVGNVVREEVMGHSKGPVLELPRTIDAPRQDFSLRLSNSNQTRCSWTFTALVEGEQRRRTVLFQVNSHCRLAQRSAAAPMRRNRHLPPRRATTARASTWVVTPVRTVSHARCKCYRVTLARSTTASVRTTHDRTTTARLRFAGTRPTLGVAPRGAALSSPHPK
jgi:hypothetical protein